MTSPEASTSGAPRHAVYFAPAIGSPWWRFGHVWFGASAAGRGGLSAQDRQHMTGAPGRYGFHATLKAPFRLAEHAGMALLNDRLVQLAGALHAVPLGAMHPRRFSGFVALTPRVQSAALNELAACCVANLDDLRAPLLPHEIARRGPDKLDDRERELLLRHGYPYVMDRFRFHMTLAICRGDAAQAVMDLAQQDVMALNRDHPLVLDRLCLFEEPMPGAPFHRVRDFSLPA